MAYVHIPGVARKKLDKKAIKLRFLGYSKNQKGYRLFDMQNRKLIIRRDVTFNETDFGQKGPSAGIDSEIETEGEEPFKISEEEEEEEESMDEEDQQQVPRRSQRSNIGVPPARLGLGEYADVTVALHTYIHT